MTLAWDGDELIVHDASQGVKRPRLDVRAGLRHRRGAGPRHLALRRRRIRRQDAVVSPSARGRRGQARRPSRARHAVARGRLSARRRSHEHRAAGRDRRRRRRSLQGAHPHRHLGDDPAQRARRAIHFPRTAHVCDRDPEDRPAGRRHGHARQLVHARARGVGRHVRAGMRDRRARDRARHGPDRAAASATSPTRTRAPGLPFSSRHLVEAWRGGRRALRLGARAQRRAPGARANG